MTGPAPALPVPDIAWTPDGPRSERFGDGYHGAADGLAEAAHVFVDGNGLPARFAEVVSGEVFTLAETGFGTGTNVLAALRAWSARGHADGHLWIVSVEGYPFSRAQMARSLGEAASRWPSIAGPARRLADAYPDPVPGQATVRLGPDATLTLLFGEVRDALAETRFAAHAWMLDGFSPRTNPAMWTDEVMARVAARSAPGATAATFTVAGAVRRALAAAGFVWAKRDGFGRKRESLTARLPGEFARRCAPRVGIVGAGIAGACASESLGRLGASVTVFDPAPASGASGNPGGLLTPRIQAADDAHARFYRDAYLHARRLYEETCPDALFPMIAEVIATPSRVEKVIGLGIWPSGALTASEDGFHAPGAAVLRPDRATHALLDNAEIVRRAPAWTPDDPARLDGEPFDAVILAAGAATAMIVPEGALGPGLTARQGQIDLFAGPASDRILSGDGYAAPLNGQALAGATYGEACFDDVPTASERDTEENAATLSRLTGAAPSKHLAARAALRLAARDRHPVAGPLGGGAYVLTALGSRGLTTAPLLGADLASAITGAPRLLPQDQMRAVAPERFAPR